MGPLLSMLDRCETAEDADKARCCLDTLRLLALDHGNCVLLNKLCGAGALLALIGRFPSHSCIRTVALEAALALSTPSGGACVLWPQHTHAVLALLAPHQPLPLLLDVLAFVQRTALSAPYPAAAPQLLEPRMLGAVASLLHPGAHPALLARCLRFLGAAAASGTAARAHAREWHAVVYQLVPLLGGAAVCNGASMLPCGHGSYGVSSRSSSSASGLTHVHGGCAWGVCGCVQCRSVAAEAGAVPPQLDLPLASAHVLLALSDADWARKALFAGGAVPPLLTLLRGKADVAIASACMLANMAGEASSRHFAHGLPSPVLLLPCIHARPLA